jgi:restriction system protein
LYVWQRIWWNTPLGSAEISPHIVRVYSRGSNARAIFISYSRFTPSAIQTCREALTGGPVVVLCELEEIVQLLNKEGNLRSWLKEKVHAAIVHKNPLYKVQLL